MYISIFKFINCTIADKDFSNYFIDKKKENESLNEDQKPCNTEMKDKICKAILKALDTTKKIVTCLEFDKLQEAYNLFADEEINKTSKEIEASVSDDQSYIEIGREIVDYNPTIEASVHNDLDENSDYRYDFKFFENFVRGLIPQILMLLIPIIHIHSKNIKKFKLKNIADLKEDDLNIEKNRLSLIYISFL